MNRLFFRTDANRLVASGHLMRCLSIADAAKEMRIDSSFIVADEGPKEIIQNKGYECIVLNSKWDNLDFELDDFLLLIKQKKIKHLIVDSYYVTEKYLASLNNATSVTYIDDINSFFYPVDTIVCYANYYEKFDYSNVYKGTHTELLLGCKYVPLRKEFYELPMKEINEKVERILILSGGSDNYHVAKRILKTLKIERYKQVDVICGIYSEDYDYLVDSFETCEIVKIHRSVENIIDFMRSSDLVVSAGGSTLYELCACGTPTVTYSFADNQLDNVISFDEMKIMFYAGDVRTVDFEIRIRELIDMVSKDYVYRKNVSRQMQLMVDSDGAKRIVKKLGI